MLNQKPVRLLELMNRWTMQVGVQERENRDIGVERKGTRDDKDFRRNSETLGSVFVMSNPPDKKLAMTHPDETEAH